MSFSESDYEDAADKLGCEVAAVKAVADVESNGATHWQPGNKPPILFEAHWFAKLTDGRFNDSHPGISSPSWNRALYKGGMAEYGRLEEAKALDESAALQSASWGAFQIMGFHWRRLGYDSPQAMVEDMQTASGQLAAFVRFIEADPRLKRAIREQDWQAFETTYNGGGFAGAYARKIEAAYARHA